MTFTATLALLLIATLLLGIGALLTGRSRLQKKCGTRPGSCGSGACDACKNDINPTSKSG